jgi:hypothetical protein
MREGSCLLLNHAVEILEQEVCDMRMFGFVVLGLGPV